MTSITSHVLLQIAPHAKPAIVIGLAQYLDPAFAHYGLDAHQMVHFLGQSAEETDGFHTLVEYASGKEYEGRHTLGNVEEGDGPRYKGRGIFQLTGRANYRIYGQKIGVDFEGHPEFAALPQYAVLTACQYWADHHIGPLADADDIVAVTKKINGGTRGLRDRVAYTKKAAAVLKAKVQLAA